MLNHKLRTFNEKILTRLKFTRDRNLIQRSHLFDRQWYLFKNPDVEKSGIDPIQHYLLHGHKEGRDPSQLFSTNEYLTANPDVSAQKMNPLVHYIRHGKKEGRSIHIENIDKTETKPHLTDQGSIGVDYLREWLISTEQKYGGFVSEIQRRKISDLDPRPRSELDQVGMQGGDRMSIHGYAQKYAEYLLPFVLQNILGSEPLTITEVGILKGTGLAIWSELFPKARIFGLDLDLTYTLENMPRLMKQGAFKTRPPELFDFDQYQDNSNLVKTIYKQTRINICFDDGVHSNEAIINSLNSLLPYMAEKFVYFIEDNSEVHRSIRRIYPFLKIENFGELTIITRKDRKSDFEIFTPIDVTLTDIEWTKKRFMEQFDKPLNIQNPITFTEKINAYKLFYRERPLSLYCDKYTVKDYITEQLGESYVIPTIKCLDHVDELIPQDLPDRFVVKTNNGSGQTFYCFNKDTFNWSDCRQKLSEAMHCDYYLKFREWCYEGITPRILVEKMIFDQNGRLPIDYKFYCFDGVPRVLYTTTERRTFRFFDFFDLDWNKLPIINGYVNSPTPPPRPDRLSEMIEIARKLSSGFPFVRIDLYSVPEVYFGEMTFYPHAGLIAIYPEEWDIRLGSYFSTSSFVNNQQLASLPTKK